MLSGVFLGEEEEKTLVKRQTRLTSGRMAMHSDSALSYGQVEGDLAHARQLARWGRLAQRQEYLGRILVAQ